MYRAICGDLITNHYLIRATLILKPVKINKTIVDFIVDDWNESFAKISGEQNFRGILLSEAVKSVDNISVFTKKLCSFANRGDPPTTELTITLNGQEFAVNIFRYAHTFVLMFDKSESKSVRSNLISSLKKSLDEKTHETYAHSERMVHLSNKMGSMLGFSDNQIDKLKLLAVLHDIGKIAISDTILGKSDALTPTEWSEMKKHCAVGYRIAASSPELVSIADSILSHHERWDGNGYPNGLKGEEIPLPSRIISVLDAYDTMTHDRVYRKKLTKKQALLEIKRCSGKQFDPRIVEVFCRMIKGEELLLVLELERSRLNQIGRIFGTDSKEVLAQSMVVDKILNDLIKSGYDHTLY